ncbi:MAG: glycosyl hydrolase family 95 catalytic domain-containing protein [Terrimicrobiaceae bacterium]
MSSSSTASRTFKSPKNGLQTPSAGTVPAIHRDSFCSFAATLRLSPPGLFQMRRAFSPQPTECRYWRRGRNPQTGTGSEIGYLPANSNYDHFLMRKLFLDLEEMAAALGRRKESLQWKGLAKALGQPATVKVPSPDGLIRGEVLSIAPDMPLDRSHRHHAHLMGIYPLNLVHPVSGGNAKDLVDDTLRQIDLLGTGEWVGYSFSWYAGLCARVGLGKTAISMLERYLDGFVSSNGFHLNGDFKNLGYSVYKYRPFTLEGNFAAVQAVNEMLLQTINGVIHIGYSLPIGISASFDQLRTEGGFLVSANIDARGALEGIEIHSTVGGLCRIANPWPDNGVVLTSSRSRRARGAILTFETDAGVTYRLSPTGKTSGTSKVKNPTRT